MRTVLFAIAFCAVGLTAARAADEGDRITVTASGTASLKPDVAEVRASVSGSAAMAVDALRKFQDNRRRAIEAIKKLKLESLTVEGGGVSMSSANANGNRMAMVFGGNQNAGTPGHVTLTEKLVLRLSSIDRLKEGEPAKAVAALIDAAKDAGLTIGGSGLQSDLVRFRSTKLEEARRTGCGKRDAVGTPQSRNTGESVEGARISRIVSSREVSVPSAASNNAAMSNVFVTMAMAEMGMAGGGDSDEASSAELKPIPVSVTIEVQFAADGGR